MKTLRVVSIILLFSFFASLLFHSLDSINQDIGRHIKSGQIIWETKQVYKTNLFSFTEPNNPFINHHWLSEVAFYGLNNAIGLKGLILFKIAVILLALGLLLASVYRKTGLWPLALSSLAGFMVFTERTDVRPEIFSYLFLSYFLFVIFRAKYNDVEHRYSQQRCSTSLLYTLPIVQILWTNMHIYFAVGPILLLFFLIDRYIEKRTEFPYRHASRTREPTPSKEFKQASTIFFVTCAATLLNPNFIAGALAPFNILRHYGYSIVENQNIFFLRDYGISLQSINLFQISLLVLLISFIVAFHNGYKKITFELLTAAFMSFMAIKMIRNFGIYALAFIPIVALNLSTITTVKVAIPQWFAKIGYFALSIILVFLIWQNIHADKFGLAVPAGAEKAVEFVKANDIKGPMFNNFDVGSFLIWKLYSEQKVFVDGRPEAYSVDFFEKVYKPMQEDPATWKHYADDVYHINYIFFDYHDITPWAQTFLSFISQDKNWPKVYKDSSVVIFVRKTPQK